MDSARLRWARSSETVGEEALYGAFVILKMIMDHLNKQLCIGGMYVQRVWRALFTARVGATCLNTNGIEPALQGSHYGIYGVYHFTLPRTAISTGGRWTYDIIPQKERYI